MPLINFNVAGTSFRKAARYTLGGTKARLKPDYNNPHDENAVKVFALTSSEKFPRKLRWIGYVPSKDSELVRQLLKRKKVLSCRVVEVSLYEKGTKVFPSVRVMLRLKR